MQLPTERQNHNAHIMGSHIDGGDKAHDGARVYPTIVTQQSISHPRIFCPTCRMRSVTPIFVWIAILLTVLSLYPNPKVYHALRML